MVALLHEPGGRPDLRFDLFQMPSGSLLAVHPSCAGRRIAGMKKPRRGFRHRKSGLPDLRTHKKTDLGRPEIGAHFMSFNFTNRPFR
jgi:hypothetical protein